MVVAVVVLAVVYVLTAVVGVALWLGLRQHDRMFDGLRRDTEASSRFVSANFQHAYQCAEAAQHTATAAYNTAAIAQDRLMYYTKHSAILGGIGAKYDKAIAAIKAKAEAEAVPVASEPESEDVAPEGMAQVAGSIGIPCG